MLNKLVFIFALIITLAMTYTPGLASGKGSVESDIKKLFPQVRIDSLKYNAAFDLYEVVADGQVFYLSKDLKYLIVGNIIEIPTMRNLTVEKVASLQKISFSSLNKADAIKMSSGRRSIAVFTDPDCPFCKRLHSELKKLRDVSVYLFLYPLRSINPSLSIWCSKDRIKALDNYFSGNDRSAVPFRECPNPVERNIQFARKNNITSVPTIVFEDNRVVVGYVTAERLTNLLNKGASR